MAFSTFNLNHLFLFRAQRGTNIFVLSNKDFSSNFSMFMTSKSLSQNYSMILYARNQGSK